MNITEFLLARISDDEAVAGDAFDHWGPGLEYFEFSEMFGVAISRSRLLAECAAKRAIVAAHRTDEAHPESCWICGTTTKPIPDVGHELVHCTTLRALAAVYADHPDYDPRWAL